MHIGMCSIAPGTGTCILEKLRKIFLSLSVLYTSVSIQLKFRNCHKLSPHQLHAGIR